MGSGGTILKTSNSGGSWISQSSETTNPLRSVHFSDTQTGWALGNGGIILKTTNGGNNWISQSSGTGNWLYSVHFIDPLHGWVVGDFGTILKYDPIASNTTKFSKQNLEVKLYPNPLNNGLLNLECEETCALSIYDAAGKLKFEKDNIKSKETIPLTLKPGFYFATAKTENRRQTIKLVVEAH